MTDRRATAALWTLFVAVAVVSCVLVLRRPPGDRLSDLHVYYGAAQTVGAGQPLYDYVADNGGPFTYPPFAVLVLRPFTLVPEGALRIVWLVLVCAAVAAIAAAVARGRRGAVVAATACALLLSAPAQSNLRFGQVSVFIVLLALVDALGLTPARYRGVLVGVAAAVKLTPLLFVVFFLVARRRDDFVRSVAAFVGGGLVGFAVLPSDSVRYWTSAVAATSRIGDLASLGNQSVRGMLLRVGVEQSALPVLWLAIVAAICAVALLRARQLALAGDPTRAAVLVGCATVAASPVSWTHHQLWTVLAAMLLVAALGALQRIAGAALFVAMTLSLGMVLAPVSTKPGVQFALENARTLGAVAVCCLGFGGVAMAALSVRRRVWWRAAAAGAAGLALVALLPLPASADPTFKAYTAADVPNPRYFYACASRSACAALVSGSAVGFRIAHEKTKVRVNGVVDAAVARMEYRSAPGGAPRLIPLVEWYPGQRGFSFRSATLAHGRLTAYDTAGALVADLSP